MAKVTVLGGCGAVGSVSVRTLVSHPEFSEIVIADFNIEKAKQLAAQLASPKVSVKQFNALEPASVKEAIKGSDVVLNCVGPFYTTVKPMLTAVIEMGINYVDVCDDVDVTIEILNMDAAAKKAGISALIGMGSSPGVTNIIAKLAAESLFDETESIDIFHAHGGEKIEGEGVIGHRFHCMTIDIPMFLDGELKYVKFFKEDGIALRENFNFPQIGEVPALPLSPSRADHHTEVHQAETRHQQGNRHPRRLLQPYPRPVRPGTARQGAGHGQGHSRWCPHDFAMAFIIRERERILKETNFGDAARLRLGHREREEGREEAGIPRPHGVAEPGPRRRHGNPRGHGRHRDAPGEDQDEGRDAARGLREPARIHRAHAGGDGHGRIRRRAPSRGSSSRGSTRTGRYRTSTSMDDIIP